MSKQRWIKVSIEYREGNFAAWDAVTLGDSSMVELVEDPATFRAATLGEIVELAASELVRRSERVMPPKAEPDPEPATT